MTDDDDLVITFVPALIVLLFAAERASELPLTEEEVLAVRDGATCVRLRRSVADGMAAERGYADLDPEDCWEQWQVVRAQLDG